jgi:phage gp37-like protein
MIAVIETAIIDLIKATPLPYKLATVASYGGELDDELENVVRSFPAVWVTFSGGAKPERTGNRTWRVPCTFSVLCGVRSPRDEQATRHGLKVAGQLREVGVYQMLLDVRNLLINSDLGLSITPFAPGAVRTLYNTKLRTEALAVFGQEWHTSFVLHQDAPPVLPAGMLNTVGMNYLGEPGGKTLASDQLTTR